MLTAFFDSLRGR